MTTPIRYYPFGPVESGNDVVLVRVINGETNVAVLDGENVLFLPFKNLRNTTNNTGNQMNTRNQMDTGNQTMTQNQSSCKKQGRCRSPGVNQNRNSRTNSSTSSQTNSLTINSTALDPTVNNALTSNILVLKVTGNPDSLTARVKFPVLSTQMYLGTSSSEEFIITESPANLVLRSKYANPPKKYSLFSGVEYTINNSSPVFILSSSYTMRTSADMSSHMCTKMTEDPLGAVRNFNDKTISFVRMSDCSRGVMYDYCLKGEYCGKCFGPCHSENSNVSSTNSTNSTNQNSTTSNLMMSENTDSCYYSTPGSAGYKGNTFECIDKQITTDVEPIVPINLQGWYITLIIIVVIIAIFVAFWAFYSHRKTENPSYKGENHKNISNTSETISPISYTKKTIIYDNKNGPG